MKSWMRTLVILFLVCSMLLNGSGWSPAEAGDIKLVINGVRIHSDVPPFLHNNRTLVPVRVIAERLGAEVQWNQSLRRVTIIRENTTIVLFIGSSEAWVNDRLITLDTEPLIRDGRTMVPVRFISQRFGAEVDWDGANRTVYVDSSPIKLHDINYQDQAGQGRLLLQTCQEAVFQSTISADNRTIWVNLPGTAAGVPIGTTSIQRGGVRSFTVQVLSDGSAQVQINLADGQFFEEEITGQSYQLRLPRMVNQVFFTGDIGLDQVSVVLSGPVQTKGFSLEEPWRVVVDMEQAILGGGPGQQDLEHPVIQRIRYAQHSPEVVRVVADLKKAVPYRLEEENEQVRLVFASLIKEVALNEDEQGLRITIQSENGQAMGEASGSSRIIWTLPDAVWAEDAVIRYRQDGQEKSVWTWEQVQDSMHLSESFLRSFRIQSTADNGLRLELDLQSSCLDRHLTHVSRTESILTILKPPPLPLAGKVIVLDPGHGGSEPGAVGPTGTTEKEVNLAISLKLREELHKQGATVVMTRDRDKHVTLLERAAIANQAQADLFISVHANGFHLQSAHGTETYYHPDNHPDSLRLGQQIHPKLVAAVGLRDRGLKTANFTVLRETVMPSVLVEVAFLTNPDEERLLKDPTFQQKAALGISQGVLAFFANS